jgi:hypothetical protein
MTPHFLAVTTSAVGLLSACAPNSTRTDDVPPTTFPHVISHDGTWSVAWTTPPTGVPLNETWAMDVWIRPANAEPEDAVPSSLSFDARMPHHRHGMNQIPTVTQLQPGECRWRIEGIRLHMPGTWFFYWDIDDGTVIERAEHRIELQ